MAYSVVINKARGGTVGKPGPPIQSNVNGAIVLIYEVTETDVSPSDEFTLECVPSMGIVSLYGAEIVDSAGGIVAHLQPSIGTAPGFAPNTLDHVWTLCVPTTKPVREANPAAYVSPSLRLVVRSGVFAPGGSIRHRFAITEGHGHPVGLGAGYSRTNPVPVELLPKAVFFGGFFTDGNGSSQMAVDARFTGATIEVHNGTDNIYWTGVNAVGASATFDDTTRFFDGAMSVLVAAPGTGDTYGFDAGGIIDVSGFLAIEIRIWVVGNWTLSDVVELYAIDGTGEIGNRVNLGSAIERSQVGTWQSAVITVASLNVTLITGIRVEQVLRAGQGPTYSVDAAKFRESGGPIVYATAAPPGFRIRITCVIITITAAYDGTVGVSPIGFLTLPTLPIGILVVVVTNGMAIITAVVRDLRDTGKFGYLVRDPVLAAPDGSVTAIHIVREYDTALVFEGSALLNNFQFRLADDFTDWDDGEAIWTGNIELI